MHRRRLIVLAVLFVASVVAYMTIGARGNWGFVLEFRGAKLAALCLVAVALSTSTVLFQTITQNRILTPSIMGFDELFVLIVAMGVFVFGMADYLVVTSWIQFGVSLVLMTGASLLLFGTLLLQERPDLMRMILTGLVLTVLFRSLRTLLVRMLDPNEFSVVQVSSYARFHQIETGLLAIAAVTIVAALVGAWVMRHRLDVLSLGREAAINLGEDVRRGTLQVLVLIGVLVSVATALVGPTAFLGLLVVSIAHAVTPTGRHAVLLVSAALISGTTLVGGQALLERVFGLVTPLTVVIDLAGGVLFLVLVMKGLKR
ncbi:iron chelate uptake ABC transporter family permease subunit [Roseovarius sp. SK2]|uniref:iron chelate uptake ABC transporter family permease subunit n=1 Tax=Roseovarius TaxID=74030 RepID=UPI00237AC631|nr:iron chelate uptake ABC transporter family permease subunit [Roseovarius sp. SK2]MDD9726819.1 iron chelate uptake ABC transporter family permease subunit [Roseovarius sp. SK2]